MTKDKKKLLFAKWLERLGILALGSLAFQGLIKEGGVSIFSVAVGMTMAIISYGLAVYLVSKV